MYLGCEKIFLLFILAWITMFKYAKRNVSQNCNFLGWTIVVH
jgi:hypothetical protein